MRSPSKYRVEQITTSSAGGPNSPSGPVYYITSAERVGAKVPSINGYKLVGDFGGYDSEFAAKQAARVLAQVEFESIPVIPSAKETF